MTEGSSEKRERVPAYVGLAAQGLLLVGVANLVLAAAAVFREIDFVGAGVCGIASALSFGLLLNGFLRR